MTLVANNKPIAEAVLKFEKETTGTLLYKEVDPNTLLPFPKHNSPGCLLSWVYIRKPEFRHELSTVNQSQPEYLIIQLRSADPTAS